MSTPETSPVPATSKPVKKRSSLERGIVWGAILLMLLVVGMEWKSQSDYTASLNKLENQLTTETPLVLSDLPQHTSGYYGRSEQVVDGERIVTLSWPSLFKTYKLILPIEKNERITSFETADWQPAPLGTPAEAPQTPPSTASQDMGSAPSTTNRRPEGEAKEETTTEDPVKDETPAKEPANVDSPDTEKSDDKPNP